MKKMIARAMISILFLCAMLPIIALGETYATPDEAINAFIEAIARNDFDGAMALCVAEPMAKAYNWQRMVTDIKAYLPTNYEMPAPGDYEVYQPINTVIAKGRFAASMYVFITSFFSEDGLDGKPFTGVEDEWIASYVKSINPAQLASLHVVKILDIQRHDEEAVIEMFQKQAIRFSAEEQVEKIAVYQLGDAYYMGSFNLLRYGDSWYIHHLNSTFSGINTYGAVYPLPDMPIEELLAEIEASL